MGQGARAFYAEEIRGGAFTITCEQGRLFETSFVMAGLRLRATVRMAGWPMRLFCVTSFHWVNGESGRIWCHNLSHGKYRSHAQIFSMASG